MVYWQFATIVAFSSKESRVFVHVLGTPLFLFFLFIVASCWRSIFLFFFFFMVISHISSLNWFLQLRLSGVRGFWEILWNHWLHWRMFQFDSQFWHGVFRRTRILREQPFAWDVQRIMKSFKSCKCWWPCFLLIC